MTLTTEELARLALQRDAFAAEVRARQYRQEERVNRGQGLRVRLKAIPGVTQGAAKKALKHPYRFQCPPLDDFTHPLKRNHERRVNYKGTEFLDRGGLPLKVITFRTIAVEWGNFVVERYYEVDELVDRLKDIVRAGYPFELLATHDYNDTPELHMDAVLESVTIVENAGEQDARYLDLSFVQWRDATVDRKRRKRKGSSDNWPKTAVLDKDGTVKLKLKGDTVEIPDATFAKLAKRVYGRASEGRHIALSQKPPVRNQGMHEPLAKMPRYKKGGKITVPEPPPRASINRPDTDAD